MRQKSKDQDMNLKVIAQMDFGGVFTYTEHIFLSRTIFQIEKPHNLDLASQTKPFNI